MQLPILILVINLISTCYMVGLIWMVQVVHYPLFEKVGSEQFVRYQTSHQSLTSLVVGPPMLVEFVSAALLVWFLPEGVPAWLVYTALVLLAVVWASTAFVQVPCHQELTNGFDEAVHSRLVRSNWIRTICWTARGGLVTSMLVCALGNGAH